MVVLPAPFGPSRPKISPVRIARLRLSTATSSPYAFVSRWVWMASSLAGDRRIRVRRGGPAFGPSAPAEAAEDPAQPDDHERDQGQPDEPPQGRGLDRRPDVDVRRGAPLVAVKVTS